MTLPRATAVIEGETRYVVTSTYDTVTTALRCRGEQYLSID
jgi:hypothetical protein